MRTLILIAAIVLAGCGDKEVTPPVTPAPLFENANVTFVDYDYNLSGSGSGARLYIDISLKNVTGINKIQLYNAAGQVNIGTPNEGINRMYDQGRSEMTNVVAYKLRFTRTDNTTFETAWFNVRK